MPTPRKYVAKDNTVTWKVRFRLGEKGCQETFDTFNKANAFCSDIHSRDANYALRVLEQNRRPTGVPLDDVAEGFFAWKSEVNPHNGKLVRIKSDRTVADYRRDYLNWISPTLGQRPVDDIDEVDVQTLVDTMTAKLSAKSVADRHAILHGIYKWAMAPKQRYVTLNPCIGTELPKRRKTPPKGLRPAEWQALYPALRAINPDAGDLALFLLASGWRISEASALSAYQVEDNGLTMHVSMGRVLRRNAANQHVFVEDDAKSDAGLRRIKLDDDVADMVRRRLDTVQGDGLVFTTSTGSRWNTSNFADRYWHKAVKAANLSRRPTPHWLRHTSVFWLIMQGANLVEIQRRIGHEHYSTTVDVYGRMVDDVAPAALEGFAAMREGRPAPTVLNVQAAEDIASRLQLDV